MTVQTTTATPASAAPAATATPAPTWLAVLARRYGSILIPIAAVAAAGLIGLVLVASTGVSIRTAIDAFVGGAVGSPYAIAASINRSVVFALVGSFWFLRGSLPVAHAVPLALVAGVLGQAGDLAESVLKRSTGIKDSGGIVPGHGGILDRVDALLLTTVVVFLYQQWVGFG